jgi:cell division transport system ATP-binding protein
VEQHEFVFLIGRTGSGKSSLLKTLYADLPLKSGLSEVVGYSLSEIKNKEVPFLRRKIGIIFQDFQLFTDRSVHENLSFVLKATGWTDPILIKERIGEVLLQVGLLEALNKMPHQLSGGEQQRVVIARALLNNPSILLADEPTGNLDPDVADGIFKLFQDINKKGTAILMATHNHELLRKYPYRVLKCEKGKLLDSTMDDISFGSTI